MSLPDKITYILNLPVSERKKQEVDILVNYLKRVPFFESKFDFESKAFRDTANAIYSKKFKDGSNVFKYGDEGDGFYVILEGTVSI